MAFNFFFTERKCKDAILMAVSFNKIIKKTYYLSIVFILFKRVTLAWKCKERSLISFHLYLYIYSVIRNSSRNITLTCLHVISCTTMWLDKQQLILVMLLLILAYKCIFIHTFLDNEKASADHDISTTKFFWNIDYA